MSSHAVTVNIIRDKELNVKGLISIFTYGFEEANQNFKKSKCEKTSLCDYESLIEEALKSNYIDQKDLAILKDWRKNPKSWPN